MEYTYHLDRDDIQCISEFTEEGLKCRMTRDIHVMKNLPNVIYATTLNNVANDVVESVLKSFKTKNTDDKEDEDTLSEEQVDASRFENAADSLLETLHKVFVLNYLKVAKNIGRTVSSLKVEIFLPLAHNIASLNTKDQLDAVSKAIDGCKGSVSNVPEQTPCSEYKVKYYLLKEARENTAKK